jgi:hypothetical protein
MKITIPIFTRTESSDTLDELNIDYELETQTELEFMTIYNINGLIPFFTKSKKEYTEIFFNGTVITSPMKIQEIEKLIDKSLNK